MLNHDQEEQLAHDYECLSNERLLDLAGSPEELMDVARELVTAEVRRRRLEMIVPSQISAVTDVDGEYKSSSELPRGERQLWSRQPGDYAHLAAPDCAFPIRDSDDAHRMRVALALADIPCDEFWPHDIADLREPMLAVLPEDSDRAKAIVSGSASDQVGKQMVRVNINPAFAAMQTCRCRSAQ